MRTLNDAIKETEDIPVSALRDVEDFINDLTDRIMEILEETGDSE